MAMFRSSEAAFATVNFPQNVTLGYLTTLSAVTVYITDGSGLQIANFDLATLLANVSLTDVEEGSFTIKFNAAFLSGKTAGAWSLSVVNTAMLQAHTSPVATFQWGGLADLIVAINTETQAGGTMYTNVERTQQAVMGNTTWDHTTGTVGMANGESFVLADEAGTPVSDQSLAVRRIDSTV